MALLADFYVSADSTAVAYDAGQKPPSSDVAQYKGITPLELSTLWAIHQGKEWEVEMMDSFPCVLNEDGGERLIHKFPPEFIAQLAALSASQLESLATKWAQTEELAADPEEIKPIVEDLKRLAATAQSSGKGLFLWNCV